MGGKKDWRGSKRISFTTLLIAVLSINFVICPTTDSKIYSISILF